MGINIKKRILVREEVLKKCEVCQKLYSAEENFCTECGSKLTSEKTKVYANWGKNGITSFSYKLPSGVTINSKGALTIPIAKGISYTTKPSKKGGS